MLVIRVGEGQSPSGKILDRGTRWYNIFGPDNIDEAIDFAMKTKRDMFVSYSKSGYQKKKIEQIIKLKEKFNKENG